MAQADARGPSDLEPASAHLQGKVDIGVGDGQSGFVETADGFEDRSPNREKRSGHGAYRARYVPRERGTGIGYRLVTPVVLGDIRPAEQDAGVLHGLVRVDRRAPTTPISGRSSRPRSRRSTRPSALPCRRWRKRASARRTSRRASVQPRPVEGFIHPDDPDRVFGAEPIERAEGFDPLAPVIDHQNLQ